jgi:hypothetical protein
MASVSPMQVYQDLLNAGASTVEAIGILANSINESNINPESVGDQGTSFGFVQDHGNFGYLVTGNPTADITEQITTIKGLGAFGDASGSTGAQAAGNFSADFERCIGCQPGGAQYNQRVANAATVEGWIKSGNWPQSAGTSGSAGPAANAATSSDILSDPLANIGSDLITGILSKLGLPSLTDLLERLGLILFGAALIFLGIHLLASGGKQPFNINVSESQSPGGGSTKTRTVKTPVSIHKSTTRSAAAGGTAKKGLATEAVEAAAVALSNRFCRRWPQGQEYAYG